MSINSQIQIDISYEEKENINKLINKWTNISTIWRSSPYDINTINNIFDELETLYSDIAKIYDVCIIYVSKHFYIYK